MLRYVLARRALFGVAAAGLLVATASAQDVPDAAPVKLDPQNTVYLDITAGRVVIRLRPDFFTPL